MVESSGTAEEEGGAEAPSSIPTMSISLGACVLSEGALTTSSSPAHGHLFFLYFRQLSWTSSFYSHIAVPTGPQATTPPP